jgi:hypothetical protein
LYFLQQKKWGERREKLTGLHTCPPMSTARSSQAPTVKRGKQVKQSRVKQVKQSKVKQGRARRARQAARTARASTRIQERFTRIQERLLLLYRQRLLLLYRQVSPCNTAAKLLRPMYACIHTHTHIHTHAILYTYCSMLYLHPTRLY